MLKQILWSDMFFSVFAMKSFLIYSNLQNKVKKLVWLSFSWIISEITTITDMSCRKMSGMKGMLQNDSLMAYFGIFMSQ